MHGATGGHTCGQIWHDFMVQAVPIQRQFQAANPDLSDTAAAAISTPSRIPTKRKKRVVPALSHPTSAGADSGLEDQESPDPTTVAPGAPGGTEDTKQTDLGAQPDPGDSGRSSGRPNVPRIAAPPNAGLRSSPPPVSANLTPTTRPAEDELISVKVCAESGDLVNGNWCPEYVVKRVSRSVAQHMRRCRIHHAPPGEKE